MQELTCCGVPIQHQNGKAFKVLKGQNLFPERKSFGIRHKNIVEFQYGYNLHRIVQRPVGGIDNNQIGLIELKHFRTLQRGAVRYIDMYLGILLMEFLQIRNKKIPADRIACRNPDLYSAGRHGI